MPFSVETQSYANDTYDEWLRLCWSRQECGKCLATVKGKCSWCPATGTCVPNPSTLQLLAPITNPDVCPFWDERWEIRTRTLGCHVSTITLLTFLGSVLGTLLFVGLVWGAVKLGRWGRGKWKARREGWWKLSGWRWRGKKGTANGETRPLLGDGEGEGDVER